MADFCGGGNYNVEISFNRGLSAKVISSSLNKKSRKLCWVHTDYTRNPNALAGFKNEDEARFFYSQYNSVVCVSGETRNSFVKRIGDTGNLQVAYNILNVKDIIAQSNQKNKCKDNTFTIVSVGNICEAKNYTLLIDVIRVLKERGYQGIKVLIIGGGALNNLEGYIADSELDNICLLGSQNNPYKYMGAADLYLQTSLYEGLSTSTIEAMIIGLPIIVTDCVGMKEIVGNNNEYGIVTSFEKEIIADEVEKMIIDIEYRKFYSTQSAEGAKRFSEEFLYDKIYNLIEE